MYVEQSSCVNVKVKRSVGYPQTCTTTTLHHLSSFPPQLVVDVTVCQSTFRGSVICPSCSSVCGPDSCPSPGTLSFCVILSHFIPLPSPSNSQMYNTLPHIFSTSLPPFSFSLSHSLPPPPPPPPPLPLPPPPLSFFPCSLSFLSPSVSPYSTVYRTSLLSRQCQGISTSEIQLQYRDTYRDNYRDTHSRRDWSCHSPTSLHSTTRTSWTYYEVDIHVYNMHFLNLSV